MPGIGSPGRARHVWNELEAEAKLLLAGHVQLCQRLPWLNEEVMAMSALSCVFSWSAQEPNGVMFFGWWEFS